MQSFVFDNIHLVLAHNMHIFLCLRECLTFEREGLIILHGKQPTTSETLPKLTCSGTGSI